MAAAGPVAVVDSGLGGLTVLRHMMASLPETPMVYFGDTARLPYGNKSPSVVTSFLLQIVEFLSPLDPREVVIACNTATALALPAVRAAFPGLHVSGVIEPGAKAAVAAWKAGCLRESSVSERGDRGRGPVIGLLATEATVRSGAYERAVRRLLPAARLHAWAAPLLVPVIEEGRGDDDPVARMVVRDYLRPLVEAQVDVVLLGCTHYPIYRRLFERTLDELSWPVPVVDASEQAAREVAARCGRSSGWMAAAGRRGVDDADGLPVRCFVTDDPGRFQRLAGRFLGMSLPAPKWIAPERLPQREAQRWQIRPAG